MRFRSSEMIYLDSNSMRVIGGHIEQYNDNLQSLDAQHKDYSSTEASDMTCSPVSNSSALSNSSHHYSSQTRINLEMNGLEAGMIWPWALYNHHLHLMSICHNYARSIYIIEYHYVVAPSFPLVSLNNYMYINHWHCMHCLIFILRGKCQKKVYLLAT